MSEPVRMTDSHMTPLVAMVGNPNAGKTTLFNVLTGSSQKVGNYPGVTVEKVSAFLKIDGVRVEVVDVPGLYSLSPVSEDEKVAVGVLEGEAGLERKPDLLVAVLDSGNLERNLYVFSQLVETGIPLLVALTMTDVIKQRGATIDIIKLANLLGVEVVPVVAHKKIGVNELKEAIARQLADPKRPDPDLGPPNPLQIKAASLKEGLARSGLDFTLAELREALTTGFEAMDARLEEMPDMREAFQAAHKEMLGRQDSAESPGVGDRYKWAAMVNRACYQADSGRRPRTFTDRIDLILTHRVFGLIIFAGIMYLVFQSIYTFASPLMDLIDSGFSFLGDKVSPLLDRWPIAQSLMVDGIIGGVGGAIIFLPQICILFFFIAVLEGTGYLARAAFLMDKLLGWCGLNGRAFIPLLSSYACAIPGIMAARVMPDKKSRLATILVAPLMSCSARLPVYVLLIGAFIEPKFGAFWAGFTLFAMHLLGLVVAIPVVWFLNRGVIKGKRLPFLLELPPYQLPKWRDIWLSLYFRAKTFLQTAGTIIVVMSIVIWGLLYFPRSDEANERYASDFKRANIGATQEQVDHYVDAKQLENSLLGQFGRTIEPAFVPAGFDWRLTTAILSAFPAREVVVASMGIIFNLGEDQDESSNDLRNAIQKATWPDGRPLVTPLTAIGLMVFFALCCQCMATLAAVKRETGTWKWPVFMFVYMTGLAYIFAVAIHQIGRAMGAT